MPTRLTSQHNPRIKAVIRLGKRRERDRQRLTVVEGKREVERALNAGIVPVEAFVCPELSGDGHAARDRLSQLDRERRTHLFEIPREIYARIAYRSDSGGILLVIPYLNLDLARIEPSRRAFVAIIEGVEKPGNLGAIARSADGAGVDGLVVCTDTGQPATDLHNPNAIRASLGTVFSLPIAEASSATAVDWARKHGMTIVIATPATAQSYTEVDMRQPVAIVLGSEAFGLSSTWTDAAQQSVRIPMAGVADSLNLSTSAALLLYEVVRQRA